MSFFNFYVIIAVYGLSTRVDQATSSPLHIDPGEMSETVGLTVSPLINADK